MHAPSPGRREIPHGHDRELEVLEAVARVQGRPQARAEVAPVHVQEEDGLDRVRERVRHKVGLHKCLDAPSLPRLCH